MSVKSCSFGSVNAVQDIHAYPEIYEAKCIFPWKDAHSGTVYQGCLNARGISWCPTRIDGDVFVERNGDNYAVCQTQSTSKVSVDYSISAKT